MAKSRQRLILNVLPFDHPGKNITVGFYREKQPQMAPLQAREFPAGFKDAGSGSRQKPDTLYTKFKDPEEADIPLSVDLTHSTRFAAHYYNHKVFEAMRGVANFRRRNFINSNQLWFRDEQADHGGLAAFKKFVVKATTGRYTGGPELTVMFDGHSYVYPGSVHEYEPKTELNYVLYGGYCFKFKDIPDGFDIDYSKVYPVVNNTMRDRLGVYLPFRPRINKVEHYYRQIEDFRQTCLMAPEFREVIPLKDKGWMRVKDRHYSRTSYGSNTLLFGGGATHTIPYYGVKKHGPYKTPEQRYVKIFFIMHENDRQKSGKRLYDYLRGKARGFDGLGEYVNMPVDISDEHLIFTDADNPYTEVAEKLQNRNFNSEYRYLAVYLSPIKKEEKDPLKYRVYFRIKEELLKYGITSQVVERHKVMDTKFWLALPNIAVAILAKLGGIPWQLNNPPRPELIVGVGAFKPEDMNRRYVGNAFCFTSNGRFRGFECYTAEETNMLAGSIREAVRTYVREKPDIERLVIHFYKRMSYKERKPIMHMLHNLGLDIPVVVITVNKTEARDIVLFDEASKDKIPLSGTYTMLRDRTILLCNNTRYKIDSNGLRNYPFPVKIKLSSTDGAMHKNRDEVRQLVEQVYQFSRIYWKSVTQQNLPVSIKYPELVARMFPYFEGSVLPRFGRESLWFL